MNTAQQVRVWVSIGLAVLLGLSVVGMLGSLTSVNDFAGTGKTALYTTDASAFYVWFAFAVILMVAEAVLAGFIIYRMYKPLTTVSASPGGPVVSQPPASPGGPVVSQPPVSPGGPAVSQPPVSPGGPVVSQPPVSIERRG